MMFNGNQYNIYIVAISFIGGVNRSIRSKTTDLLQITDKLYHIMFIDYISPWTGFDLTSLILTGTDYTGSCKYDHDHDGPFYTLKDTIANKNLISKL